MWFNLDRITVTYSKAMVKEAKSLCGQLLLQKCHCHSLPSLGYASNKICLQLRFIWEIAFPLNYDLCFLSRDKMNLQPILPAIVVLSGKESLLGPVCN